MMKTGMLKYFLTVGASAAKPKTFKPDKKMFFKLSDGSKAELYMEGEEYSGATYFEGVVKDRMIVQLIERTPRIRAESLAEAKSPALFLQSLDGFFAGLVVGDDVVIFRDHVGLIPLYVSESMPAYITNVPAEAAAWSPNLKPLKPGTVVNILTGRSSKIWNYEEVKGGVKDLLQYLAEGLKRLCPRGHAIFFSGGLDSLILAKLCNDLGLNPKLLTIGVAKSVDFERSMKAAKLLGLEVDKVVVDDRMVMTALKKLEPLLGRGSIMDRAIAAAMNILSAKACEIGCSATVSGQGADELFAGYKKYETALTAEGYMAVDKMMYNDFSSLHEYGLPRDFTAVRLSGTYLITPYLSRKVVENATTIPLTQKIAVENGRIVRKIVLRELCRLLGLAELAEVEKKALQYGSGLDKMLRRMEKKL